MNKSVSVSAVSLLNGVGEAPTTKKTVFTPDRSNSEGPPAKKMASTPDWPEMEHITDAEWMELHKLRKKPAPRDAKTDIRCKAEIGRLLGVRTFMLTKSGSKFVCTGVDPLGFNEPTLQVRNRVVSGYISFSQPEFEEFLTCLPNILELIQDVEREEDEDNYKIIATLQSYNVTLLPYRVAKFQHTSLPSCPFDDVCMSIDTLKVFTRIGTHLLDQLHELKRTKTMYPRMDFFAADLALKVVRDNGGTLSDECVYQFITDNYNRCTYTAHELFINYHHHLVREVNRIVTHMNTYNDYSF